MVKLKPKRADPMSVLWEALGILGELGLIEVLSKLLRFQPPLEPLMPANFCG